jgi:hypothetical protein
MTKNVFRALLLLALVAASVPGAFSQQADVDSLLDAVRADMRADKITIVSQAMKLQPAESETFWVVYHEYESEVIKLNDQRIAFLKDYAAKYGTLSNADAKTLANRFFDWETSRTKLRKTYFDKFAKATSAATAAKFFQVEHRLDLLVDLDLANQIPGLFERPAAAAVK